ncbi:MAG: hypothetical protein UZ02_AOB001001898 [Nitrosomonas europaea]|nr:MAG: hypothetical protein UZ02_AOB001001898 [Nitrosomonas europaea]
MTIIIDAVVIQFATVGQVLAELIIQMAAQLLHVAAVVVVGIAGGGLPAVSGEFAGSHVARGFRLMAVNASNQAGLQAAGIRGVEPFAADVVQTVTWIVGATDDFDILDICHFQKTTALNVRSR